MSLAYALTFFCDAMLYFAALGCLGLLRACGAEAAWVPVLLGAGCWLSGRLMGRGRLRWLGMAAIAPCPFLAGSVPGALLCLPAMVYLPLYVLNNRRAPDYDYAADRFRHSLIAAGVVMLFAALFRARSWQRGLSYLFLYFTLNMTLLRLLRHDDRVARSRRFRALNLAGVALVCGLGFALSQPGIVAALRTGWLWFGEHVLLNLLALAVYAIQWVLYGAAWLLSRFTGPIDLAADMPALESQPPNQPGLSEAAVAVRELPLLVRLAVQGAGIALLAALAFLALRALSQRVARADATGAGDTRESLDDGPADRRPRARGRREPGDGVRRQYRRALAALRSRGGHIAPTMNTLQIQRENASLADPDAMRRLREIYLPVRYGGRPASPGDVARAREAADEIRRSKTE